MLEKTSNVFKQGYSDDLYQEIVSFLNSCKGKILIGYDENGTLIGLDDAKFLKEKITKEILNKITPNCSIGSLEVCAIDLTIFKNIIYINKLIYIKLRNVVSNLFIF